MKDLLKLNRLAIAYGKARAKYLVVVDQVDKVRGLDEFNTKHMAWERRLFRVEQQKERTKESLLNAAFLWTKEVSKK
jgi:hypothetical protein